MVSSDAVYNQELSWLSFNWRVIAQAADPATPLFERLRFLAIAARNLVRAVASRAARCCLPLTRFAFAQDEFFGKRVGALKRQEAAGLENLLAKRDKMVWTPTEQLRLISEAVREMLDTTTTLLLTEVLPKLRAVGVSLVDYAELAPREVAGLRAYFLEKIEPLLTPLAVDPGHPFPFLGSLSLSLAVELAEEGAGEGGVEPVRQARCEITLPLSQHIQSRALTSTVAAFSSSSRL